MVQGLEFGVYIRRGLILRRSFGRRGRRRRLGSGGRLDVSFMAEGSAFMVPTRCQISGIILPSRRRLGSSGRL